MSNEITREYEHLITGERAGAYVGTARDDAFQSDVHWKLIDGPEVTGPRMVDPADPRSPVQAQSEPDEVPETEGGE
jgi:hypothetical protein